MDENGALYFKSRATEIITVPGASVFKNFIKIISK